MNIHKSQIVVSCTFSGHLGKIHNYPVFGRPSGNSMNKINYVKQKNENVQLSDP